MSPSEKPIKTEDNPTMDNKRVREVQMTVESEVYKNVPPYKEFYNAKSSWSNCIEDVLLLANETLNENGKKPS